MDRASPPSNVRDDLLHYLMNTYGTAILRMCFMYLRDASMAEDAMQDTFIKAYKHMDDAILHTPDAEKPWLMRIAINTCKDYKRSAWIRHVDRRVDPACLPLSEAFTSDADLSLFQAIEGLPRKLKECVLLYYYQDMTVHDIASTLGISESTVYSRLKRAQNKIRIDLVEREGLM